MSIKLLNTRTLKSPLQSTVHVKICVGLLLLSLGWMVVELLSSFGGEVVNDFASGTTLHELLDENDSLSRSLPHKSCAKPPK